MSRMHPLDKAALALGLASIASVVFTWKDLGDFRFMTVGGASIAVALAVGALAVLGALIGRRSVEALAGLLFAAAAAVQLTAASLGEQWLGANLSTMAFWLGLAIGLLLVGLTGRDDHISTDSPDDTLQGE
jgi:peptidoglycan/LPS O-acetylase OafA/YrhL